MKFFGNLCPFCEKRIHTNDFLCEQCRAKIEAYNKLHKCSLCGQPRTSESVCLTCKERKPAVSLAASCYHYDGIFRDALLGYKFQHQFYKANGFGKLLLEKLEKMGLEIDCITAVPIGPLAFKKRGYNAPLEIAYVMNRSLKLPCYANLLLKRWFAKRQSTLSAGQRRRNAKGTFFINPLHKTKLQGKRILLIDDVYTTGSTSDECARILKKYGAKDVYLLTLLGNAPQ